MFDTLKRYKVTLLSILVLIGVGYSAYLMFSRSTVSDEPFTGQDVLINGTIAGQEILAILEDIQNINLNVEIFYNEKFSSLIDFTKDKKSEAQGRNNPFEPIGFGIDIEGKIVKPSDLEE